MHRLVALLAASLALTAGGSVQVLPFGEFAARDGRPGPGKTWKLDDAAGARLAAEVNRVAALTPIVIDYEHQTLHTATNGQRAPAAGWITKVEWLTGKGLFAEVDWTDAARAAIAAKEYRFFSPVITHDDATGQVTGVLLGALVNYPALLGMQAAEAALSAFNFDPTTQARNTDMTLLATLIAALGLAANTTEVDLTTAVTALKAKADTPPPKAALPAALVTALGLQASADEAAALSAVAALKTPAETAAVTIAALHTQLNALQAQVNGDKVQQLVDQALTEGKLVPAMKDWALQLGRKDIAQLSTYLAAAPAVPGLNGQTQGKPAVDANGAVSALSATQAAIAAQLGIKPEDYLKQINEAAKAAA